MVTAARTVGRIGTPQQQPWPAFGVAVAFGSLVVAAIVMCVAAVGGTTFPGDERLMRAFQSHDAPVWRAFMAGITDVGGGWVAMTVAGLLALSLFLRGRVIDALATAAIFSVTVVIPALKQAVERPRPSGTSVTLMTHFSGGSFPSGHAALAMIFCGVLFYLAPRLVGAGRRMWALRAGLVALLLFTGLSRVYLGVHWPSDVVGGFLVGAVMVGVIAASHMLAMRRLGPDFAHGFVKQFNRVAAAVGAAVSSLLTGQPGSARLGGPLSLTGPCNGSIVSLNRRESPSHDPGAPSGATLGASNLATCQVVL